MAPHSSTLAWKIHEWRSLVGCSPWDREESETIERLHFHFLLSCIGEGNGNPLHCSCLENPRDREAWWAAVYGVAQSRTRLKWLSSSSTYRTFWWIASRIYAQVSQSAWQRSLVIHCFKFLRTQNQLHNGVDQGQNFTAWPLSNHHLKVNFKTRGEIVPKE